MATLASNGRSAPTRAIGVAGHVSYGGILYPADYDRAWQGLERDKTIQVMLNDPIIGSVLFGIEMLVRRVDWQVTPADETTEAQELADFIQECLDDMHGYWPGETLAQVLTFIGWGWSCLEVIYKQRDETNSRYPDGRIGWDKWALRPQATRYGWDFAQDEPSALIQQDPQNLANRYVIPLDKCLLFRNTSRDNSPEGTTTLRTAYDAWYFKHELQRIEAIAYERGGAGFFVGRVPGASIEAGDTVYQAMKTVVTGIRQDAQTGIVMPSDRDENGNYLQTLESLSVGGQRAIDFDPVIKRYANEVVTTFLANVMRTGQDGVGSYALADTQSGLFQQAIGAHLDTIAMTINEQAILPLLRLNGFDDELMPTLTHGDIESADLTRLGTYLLNLSNSGLLADTPELKIFVHEVAGLPAPTIEELEAMQVEAEAEREAALEQARQAFDAGELASADVAEEPA